MAKKPYANFQERVVQATEAALKRNGSVGSLEMFQHMLVLQPVHVEAWRKGNEHYQVITEHIQLGPEKFGKAVHHFREWVLQRGLDARTIVPDQG